MLLQMSIYLIISVFLVASMARMILKIGNSMGDCPISERAAQTAATTIAAGYCMIGFGGVAIIGSLIPNFTLEVWAVLPALGLAAICLGLGFTHAVTTLRAVVRDIAPLQQAPEGPPLSGFAKTDTAPSAA